MITASSVGELSVNFLTCDGNREVIKYFGDSSRIRQHCSKTSCHNKTD